MSVAEVVKCWRCGEYTEDPAWTKVVNSTLVALCFPCSVKEQELFYADVEKLRRKRRERMNEDTVEQVLEDKKILQEEVKKLLLSFSRKHPKVAVGELHAVTTTLMGEQPYTSYLLEVFI